MWNVYKLAPAIIDYTVNKLQNETKTHSQHSGIPHNYRRTIASEKVVYVAIYVDFFAQVTPFTSHL